MDSKDDEVEETPSPKSYSSTVERGRRSNRRFLEESSDSDIEDDEEEPNSPLAKRDVRILEKTSGNWVRPNVHFNDGSVFNTFNHRLFAFGSVVRNWICGDRIKVVPRDTWMGIDPYLLTNLRTETSVSAHSW